MGDPIDTEAVRARWRDIDGYVIDDVDALCDELDATRRERAALRITAESAQTDMEMLYDLGALAAAQRDTAEQECERWESAAADCAAERRELRRECERLRAALYEVKASTSMAAAWSRADEALASSPREAQPDRSDSYKVEPATPTRWLPEAPSDRCPNPDCVEGMVEFDQAEGTPFGGGTYVVGLSCPSCGGTGKTRPEGAEDQV